MDARHQPVVALLAAFALMMMGNGLFTALIALNLAESGHGAVVTGLVMSSFFAGLVIGALVCDKAIERVGHVRAFAAFASLVSACAVLHPILDGALPWAMLRLVSGMCIAGISMVAESWLNGSTDNANRGRVLSCYMIVYFLSSGAGPYLMTLADPSRFTLFSIACVLFSVALVPVALARSAQSTPVEPSRFGFRALYQRSPLGIVGSFGSGLLSGAILGMGVAYGAGIALDVTQIAVLVSAAQFGGLLLQYPAGWLSDRFDRRTVMVGMIALAALAALAITPLGAGEATAVILLFGLFGGITLVLYPLSVAHANDYVSSNDLVAASAGLLLAYSTGASIGPLAASGVMAMSGPQGLFEFAAVVAAGLGAFVLYRMTRRAAVPADEQSAYVSVPTLSPVAYEMDPRLEEPSGDRSALPDSAVPPAVPRAPDTAVTAGTAL